MGAFLKNTHLGDVKKAVEYYEKAFRITKETGDRRSEGTLLNNLGATFEDENKYKEARAICWPKRYTPG